MKRIWVIFTTLGTILLTTGCGGDESGGNDPEKLYKNKCIACHGGELQGASGPALTNLADKYSSEEVHDIILNGVGNMPGGLLSEEQSQIVTDWLMEK